MAFPSVADLLNAAFGLDWWLPLPTFGLLVATAIVVASLVAKAGVRWQQAHGHLPDSTHEIVADLALLTAFAGLVGARLFYIADHLDDFLADPAALIFTRSGFSIYGGLCAGVPSGVIFLRHRRIPVVPMLDAVAPAMMLGYGVGRLGCQLAGDGDWGIAADMALKPEWLPGWLWAQTYDGNILGVTIALPGVYPTPLYECAAAVGLFAGLWMLRSPRWQPGFGFSLYLVLAGFERLLIEKIRVNVEHEVLGLLLTQAEAVSLAVILAGLAGMLWTQRARALWVRVMVALGILTALSACVPW